jgi:fructuronate reductase
MPKLVHLGLGNFHRAHQAWYTHVANRNAAQAWEITGIAMRNPAIRDAMAGECAYDLGIMEPGGLRVERVAVHDRVIVAAETPALAVEAIADADVAAVTVTVTEKGYHLTPGGTLDTDDPDVASDISRGSTRSAIGLLARGLVRRFERGGGTLTVLSCDNLSGNGGLLGRAVAEFLDATGAPADTLARVVFPNTMVDRITPATTRDIAARMAKVAGRPVTAPVLTEAFSEWVIEDTAGPLPDWASAGVVFTTDVSRYERRKLLLLNAAHSALAYGGLLRGHTYVHEAIADPDLNRHIRALWAEAAPLLPEFSRTELEAYKDALVSRFSVAGMAHRLQQIAMDGSVKLPQRILPILRHHGCLAPAAETVLADWWNLLTLRAERDEPLDDPMAAALHGAMDDATPEPDRYLRALQYLGLSKDDLPDGFAQRP